MSANENSGASYLFNFTAGSADEFQWRRLSPSPSNYRSGSSHLDLNNLSNRFLQHLRPVEADLINVARATFISDKLGIRRCRGLSDPALCGSRTIRVRVAVREIDCWTDTQVLDCLHEYLYFNTGDNWQFEFVPLPESQKSPLKGYLPLDIEEAHRRRYPQLRISLFSNGLDSLAGLSHQLAAYPQARLALISFNTHPKITTQQNELRSRLPTSMQDRIIHVPLSLKIYSEKAKKEMNPRTRGFVFLAAGSAAAALLGRQEFYVWENGLGAFNLPFDRSQFIGDNSRAVHPRSLILFSKFIKALTGRSLRISNDFEFLTKGEVCKHLSASPWRDLIVKTFTCGHPQRLEGVDVQHCGICSSDILRRQGLRVAGLSAYDTTAYRYDLSDGLAVPTEKRLEWMNKRLEWRKVNDQYRLLSEILNSPSVESDTTRNTWLALVKELPELALTAHELARDRGVEDHAIQREILRLFRTYISEGLSLKPTLETVGMPTPDEYHIVERAAA